VSAITNVKRQITDAKPKIIAAVKVFLEWVLWFPGQWVLNAFWPRRIPYGLAIFWGRITVFCARSRRRVLRQEFDKISPVLNHNQAELEGILNRSMVLDAVDHLEMLCYPRFGAHTKGKALSLRSMPSIEGVVHLDRALARGGVILLHLHFGAMQMVLPALAHRGYSIAQVGNSRLAVFDDPTKWRSRLFRKVLVKQKRFEESLPAPFLYTGIDTREIVRWLKSGKVVDLALDGRSGSNWLDVSFLGRRASFSGNPFRLAQLTGSSVLPVFVIRDTESLQIRVVIREPILLPEGKSPEDYTHALVSFLNIAEAYIRAYPCHFCRRLWVMRRQKPHLSHPLFLD